MTDFIIWAVIVGVLAIVTALCYRFGCLNQAKAILLHLVVEAEERWGGGTGAIKFSEVAERLYEKLPNAAKILLSEKTIAALIENAVVQMKNILAQ